MNSDQEIPTLENFIKILALKLYASGKSTRNCFVTKLGSDPLVDNQRIPKFSHILSCVSKDFISNWNSSRLRNT